MRKFIELAAKELGITIAWKGKGVNEVGFVKAIKPLPGLDAEIKSKKGDVIVRVDPKFYRPAEVETLLGNPAKSRKVLGWKSEISFEGLVSEMAASDLRLALSEHCLSKAGYGAVKNC